MPELLFVDLMLDFLLQLKIQLGQKRGKTDPRLGFVQKRLQNQLVRWPWRWAPPTVLKRAITASTKPSRNSSFSSQQACAPLLTSYNGRMDDSKTHRIKQKKINRLETLNCLATFLISFDLVHAWEGEIGLNCETMIAD